MAQVRYLCRTCREPIECPVFGRLKDGTVYRRWYCRKCQVSCSCTADCTIDQPIEVPIEDDPCPA